MCVMMFEGEDMVTFCVRSGFACFLSLSDSVLNKHRLTLQIMKSFIHLFLNFYHKIHICDNLTLKFLSYMRSSSVVKGKITGLELRISDF